ncbi:hypothetical protein [Enterococcus ratti]|uniref:hypothetical protein n=1 Tax=Enterococcus ratti TaxID=150033 RepID=UPI0009004848|nr:hypothetical protein [Enterococcus ratti]
MDESERLALINYQIQRNLEKEQEELMVVQKKGEQLIQESFAAICQLYQASSKEIQVQVFVHARQTVKRLQVSYHMELLLKKKRILQRLEVVKRIYKND